MTTARGGRVSSQSMQHHDIGDEHGRDTGEHESAAGLTRRRALLGAATVGLTLPLLAACAGDDGATGVATDTPEETGATSPSPGTPEETPTGSPAPEDTESAPSGGAGLTSTADIPVGGGVIFADSRVVVTQPEAGDFKCFSAVCTHTGCIVSGVSSTILCMCHGSSFDLSTGEVLGGPAPAPLPAVDFTIDNEQVVLS